MKTLSCINVSYGHEKGMYQIFDCSFQHKDGHNVSMNVFVNRRFSRLEDMYKSIIKVAYVNGYKVPNYNAFNAKWYAVNFLNVFDDAPVFLRYAIKEKSVE